MDTKLKTYFISIVWFLLSLISSSINDIISKYAGFRLHSYEITFFRFLFGTITLLPIIFYYGKSSIKTSRPLIHLCRGALLFFGSAGWTYGLSITTVTTATVISFTIPLFTLILGIFFLSEKIFWQRWAVTIVGFVGIALTLNPSSEGFNPEVFVFLLSTFAFAALDIINKRFIIKETMISMLFYSAIITAFLAFPFSVTYWQTPNLSELGLLLVLGASGNLILFFLLKAFEKTDATALSPYRYLELILSAIFAYFIFAEVPLNSTIYGAIVIIPSTLFIIYSEKQQFLKKSKIEEGGQ